MASFQGSARSVRFNPIQAPDNANRVLQAGQDRIKSLREAYKADIDIRNEYAQQIAQSQNETRNQENFNRGLQNEFERVYEQSLKKQHQQKIAKLQADTKNERTFYDRLSSFSKTALDISGKLIEKNKQDQQEFGMWLASQFSITPDDLIKLKTGEADLKAENAANNAVVNRLKAAGATPDQIQAIRNLDGWRLYGAEQHMAQEAKGEWFIFLNSPENRKKKYDIGGATPVSLEDALDSNSGADYRAVRAAMQMEWSRPYQKLDRGFAQEYLWPGVSKINDVDDRAFITKSHKKLEEEERINFITDLKTSIRQLTNDPLAVNDFIQRQAGDDPKQRRAQNLKTLEILLKGRQEGDFTEQDVENFLGSMLSVENGKQISFEDKFKNAAQYEGLINRLRAFNEQEQVENYDKERKKLQIKKQQFEAESIELMRAGEVSKEDMEKLNSISREYAAQGYQPSAAFKNAMLGVDPLEQARAVQDLRHLVNTGELTMRELGKPKYDNLTPSQRAEFQKFISGTGDDAVMKPSSNVKAVLKSALFKSAGTADMSKYNTQAAMMQDFAMRDFESRYQGYLDKGIAMKEAHDQALRDIVKDIQLKINGYQTNGKFGDQFEFDSNNNTIDSTRVDTVEKAMSALEDDYTQIYSKKLLGELDPEDGRNSLIESIDVDLRKSVLAGSSSPPAWLRNLAAEHPELTWKQIANHQLRLYGLKELMETRDEYVKYAPVSSKRVQRLISSNKANFASVSRGLAHSATLTGVGRYNDMLNLIASEESQNDTVHNGYDAMNLEGTADGYPIGTTTGTEHFKTPLVEMTFGEVRKLQRDGMLHAAGRYQFIHSTLTDMENRGVLPMNITDDSKFDQATQDAIAIAYINDTINVYGKLNPKGIQARWVGLNEPKYREPILEALRNINQIPAFEGVQIKPDVALHFYTAGNIGKGAAYTGQHTDVKQQDNPRTRRNERGDKFEYDDLDDYIEVEDRELGRVPFSRLPQTGDWKSHTDRGSHGRDYGTWAGDKLYLKNGARVVEHFDSGGDGDGVIIELPDGRRFSFLHGNRVQNT